MRYTTDPTSLIVKEQVCYVTVPTVPKFFFAGLLDKTSDTSPPVIANPTNGSRVDHPSMENDFFCANLYFFLYQSFLL